jgi:manganese-dependent inorganic pyrophosphatase
MAEKIYVIGHKSPDLDSVAAAISYADLKNKIAKTDIYQPAAAGEVNRETAFALEKFGFSKPEILKNAAGKKVILVDHNEFSQAVDGIKEAEIVEVLDHHKIDFSYDKPIEFCVRPWGATCTLIAQLAANNGVEFSQNMAGLMLSAILVDTVITKSPTTTDKDKEIIEKLSQIAGINWQEYGLELFKVRSSVSDLTAPEIIKSDFKDFEFKSGKFGIGQVETVDLNEFKDRNQELLTALGELKKEGGYHSVILFITDILKEGSLFLVASSDEEGVGKALGGKLENGQAYIDGIISRKKQVVPKLTEAFDK